MSEKTAVKSSRWNINKRFYVILICFFISTIFWILIALSNDYTATVVYPVEYINFPGKKVVMNDLPTRIAVNVRASGFKIMSYGFSKEQESVQVDVAANMNTNSVSSDFLALPTQSFVNDFAKELGKEVEITGFKPDSIVFSFSDLTTKRVPVSIDLLATFEKQFDSTARPTLFPAYVEVSGPPSVMYSLNSIKTERLVLNNLKSTAKGKVRLQTSRLLSYNVREVSYTVPVEKFTEGTMEVDVHPINVKEGYILKTFPDKVKVRYTVALSRYNSVETSMFDAMVDAAEVEEKKTNKLDVKLVSFPNFIKGATLEPEKVDYILRKQ